MKMLYEARLQDLGPGDFVRVECAACGHETLIPQSALLHGLRLPPGERIVNLRTAAALPGVRCAGKGGSVGQMALEDLP
jgi:hypothetical protein